MKSTALSRTATISLFVFVLFCFVLLAYRSEVNSARLDQQVREITLSQWESCIGDRDIITRFNQQQYELAQVERTQDLAPKLAERRIKIYERGMQPVPECGPRPE